MAFVLIFGFIILGNVAWWYWADRRLRPLPYAGLWRTLLGLFIGGQIAYLAAFFVFPTWSRQSHNDLPADLLAMFYLWAILVLPVTIVLTLPQAAARRIVGWFRRRPATLAAATPSPDKILATDAVEPPLPPLTRRQLLGAAAVAVPLLVTGVGVAYGRRSLYDVWPKPVPMYIPNLPADLHGLTIAHITDVHVGKFVTEPYLRRVSDLANSLKADLHLLTGDLIDLSIGDLPGAMDFVKRLDPKHGLAMCMGNHDLIDDGDRFYNTVTRGGVPLLVDDTTSIRIPGRPTPVQLCGLRWGAPAGGRRDGEAGIPGAMDRLVPQKREGEFPILLAHHPHAFDAAAAAGFPLTLAGHTHGGLLMLSETVGPAAVMYRYFRGEYKRGDARLYVSTGVGSWFPLRTAARPEVAHITLLRA